MTVEGRKSPWIQPGGAVTRALDGFLPLAPCLPFVIAAVVVEVEWNSSRRSRVEAEKAEEMERKGGGALFQPRTVASYSPPSGSLTRGPARSQGIPITEGE